VGDGGLAAALITEGSGAGAPPMWCARAATHVHHHNLHGGQMSITTSTILVADEHDATRAFLADNLTADGYRVLTAPDRATAVALLATAQPDLILVDVNGHTLALVDAIRSGEGLAGRVDPETPLIVLCRDADRLQRIRMLERGGDDVVRKPFAYPELRARVAAVLRRAGPRSPSALLRAGPVRIDVRSREVRVSDRAVALSGKEYALLLALAGEPTRVFTRAELMRGIWGPVTFGHTRTLDSHASRLRRKLCAGAPDRLVINVWGVGYRLIDGPLPHPQPGAPAR
jgi:DNA-binding response OmpR family regulator